MEECYDEKFSTSYRIYSGKLINYIAKLIGDVESAAEIAHDLFTYLFARREPLDPASPSLSSFLYGAARNRAIDYLKSRNRVVMQCANLDDVIIDDTLMADLERTVCEGEVLGTLADVREKSEPLAREIIDRMVYRGQRIARVCRELDVTEYRINRTMHDFSVQVRNRLGPAYFNN
jgi:RNA polymerase sigma factor (sigma-70 family)